MTQAHTEHGPGPGPGPDPGSDPDPGPHLDIPHPPVRRGPGMGPALVVAGIAVGLVAIFGVLSAVSSGHSGTSAPLSTAPVPVAGTALKAVPAAAGLKPIEQPGTPPSNVIDALALPVGSTPVAHGHSVSNASQYDGQVTFTVPATETTVIDFYKTELDRHGWKVIQVASATGIPDGIEVLSEKGGSDGWYWEAGAVVSPTRFSGPGGARQSTRFQLRLFEVPDAA
ncbi:MAG: hypothetical protein ACYDHU_00125 [Acidimicrobiales bacterium]